MSRKQKKELCKIVAALFLFAFLMLSEKMGMFPSAFGNPWVNFLLYLCPYLLCGLPVLRKAFLGMRNRQPFDESFLMFVATVGAFATGENSEAVAVMVFYQVGEWFQSYAVGKSRKSISDLMNIVPDTANVERENGEVEEVDPEEVRIGDVLRVLPGEKIPVDGIVISGKSMIDTAALTGESVPRAAREGTELVSGCINGEGMLRIRALKEFQDSTVSRILELVENASENKSKTENFITRFARWYTPVVVFCALALAIVPSLVTGNPGVWIYRACTFLVISCPCALVISIPLAFFGGIGASSRKGILVKGSNYLELMSDVHMLVSDKTGTLTEGSFRVSEIIPAEGVPEDALLCLAAKAEEASLHPIAKSIREAWEAFCARGADEADGKYCAGRTDETFGISLGESRNIPGQGVVSVLAGEGLEKIISSDSQYQNSERQKTNPEVKQGGFVFLLGNEELLRSYGVPFEESEHEGKIVYAACLAGSGRPSYLGAILIGDRVKPHAMEALREMKRAGVKETVMLSGDREEYAKAVGRELEMDRVYAGLLPQDKVSKVEELIEELESASNDSGGTVGNAYGNRDQSSDGELCSDGTNRKAVGNGGFPQGDESEELLDKISRCLFRAAVLFNRRSRGRLCFLGDGVNDAPVLSRADVGIAMGSLGSDAAIEAADIVVMDDDLMKIPVLVRIARRTVGIAKQNIVFALFTKLLILCLGAFGFANMWLAVFADVGVAVLCILNSMRLLRG